MFILNFQIKIPSKESVVLGSTSQILFDFTEDLRRNQGYFPAYGDGSVSEGAYFAASIGFLAPCPTNPRTQK